MKSFFNRKSESQSTSSKPASKESYKFWASSTSKASGEPYRGKVLTKSENKGPPPASSSRYAEKARSSSHVRSSSDTTARPSAQVANSSPKYNTLNGPVKVDPSSYAAQQAAYNASERQSSDARPTTRAMPRSVDIMNGSIFVPPPSVTDTRERTPSRSARRDAQSHDLAASGPHRHSLTSPQMPSTTLRSPTDDQAALDREQERALRRERRRREKDRLAALEAGAQDVPRSSKREERSRKESDQVRERHRNRDREYVSSSRDREGERTTSRDRERRAERDAEGRRRVEAPADVGRERHAERDRSRPLKHAAGSAVNVPAPEPSRSRPRTRDATDAARYTDRPLADMAEKPRDSSKRPKERTHSSRDRSATKNGAEEGGDSSDSSQQRGNPISSSRHRQPTDGRTTSVPSTAPPADTRYRQVNGMNGTSASHPAQGAHGYAYPAVQLPVNLPVRALKKNDEAGFSSSDSERRRERDTTFKHQSRRREREQSEQPHSRAYVSATRPVVTPAPQPQSYPGSSRMPQIATASREQYYADAQAAYRGADRTASVQQSTTNTSAMQQEEAQRSRARDAYASSVAAVQPTNEHRSKKSRKHRAEETSAVQVSEARPNGTQQNQANTSRQFVPPHDHSPSSQVKMSAASNDAENTPLPIPPRVLASPAVNFSSALPPQASPAADHGKSLGSSRHQVSQAPYISASGALGVARQSASSDTRQIVDHRNDYRHTNQKSAPNGVSIESSSAAQTSQMDPPSVSVVEPNGRNGTGSSPKRTAANGYDAHSTVGQPTVGQSHGSRSGHPNGSGSAESTPRATQGHRTVDVSNSSPAQAQQGTPQSRVRASPPQDSQSVGQASPAHYSAQVVSGQRHTTDPSRLAVPTAAPQSQQASVPFPKSPVQSSVAIAVIPPTPQINGGLPISSSSQYKRTNSDPSRLQPHYVPASTSSPSSRNRQIEKETKDPPRAEEPSIARSNYRHPKLAELLSDAASPPPQTSGVLSAALAGVQASAEQAKAPDIRVNTAVVNGGPLTQRQQPQTSSSSNRTPAVSDSPAHHSSSQRVLPSRSQTAPDYRPSSTAPQPMSAPVGNSNAYAEYQSSSHNPTSYSSSYYPNDNRAPHSAPAAPRQPHNYPPYDHQPSSATPTSAPPQSSYSRTSDAQNPYAIRSPMPQSSARPAADPSPPAWEANQGRQQANSHSYQNGSAQPNAAGYPSVPPYPTAPAHQSAPTHSSAPPHQPAPTPVMSPPPAQYRYGSDYPGYRGNTPMSNGTADPAPREGHRRVASSPAPQSAPLLPTSATDGVRSAPAAQPPQTVKRVPSEESILKTPSSLAPSMAPIKQTSSRSSVPVSVSSQERRKGGLLNIFRTSKQSLPSQEGATPAPQHEIWHPPASAKEEERERASREEFRSTRENRPSKARTRFDLPFTSSKPKKVVLPPDTDGKDSSDDPSAPINVPIPIRERDEKRASNSKVFTPFKYLRTKRRRTVSAASVEAADGFTTAGNTVGSPTASMHSQNPIQPPAMIDPIIAARDWQEAQRPNNSRVRRPGVVFDVKHDPSEDKQKLRPVRSRHHGSYDSTTQ